MDRWVGGGYEPPCTAGWSVLMRPPTISGALVMFNTSLFHVEGSMIDGGERERTRYLSELHNHPLRNHLRSHLCKLNHTRIKKRSRKVNLPVTPTALHTLPSFTHLASPIQCTALLSFPVPTTIFSANVVPIQDTCLRENKRASTDRQEEDLRIGPPLFHKL